MSGTCGGWRIVCPDPHQHEVDYPGPFDSTILPRIGEVYFGASTTPWLLDVQWRTPTAVGGWLDCEALSWEMPLREFLDHLRAGHLWRWERLPKLLKRRGTWCEYGL